MSKSISRAAAEAPVDETGAGDWRLIRVDGSEARLTARLAVSNGLLGLTGPCPLIERRMGTVRPRRWMAGLFACTGEAHSAPALVPLPESWGLSIRIDGEEWPSTPQDRFTVRRVLDLKSGWLVNRWRSRDQGDAVAGLHSLRLVSSADRAIEMDVAWLAFRRAADVAVKLFPAVDPSPLTASVNGDGIETSEAVRTGRRAARALRIQVRPPDEAAPVGIETDGSSWRWRSWAGASLRIEQYLGVARADGRDDDPAPRARAALARACAAGWRNVMSDHRRARNERWRVADVEIDGDAGAQTAVRFAIHSLIGAANPDDDAVSIGARGLTGETYLGHVFWDTETYMLPFYILTWPAAARAMLMYRYRTLGAARAKAARLGWRGAYYAWESADTGDEAAPRQGTDAAGKHVDILSGIDEAHISADIACAVWRYWRATGDDTFFLDAGAEVILETARFWASRARREADGQWHIRCVEGPDEYHQKVDDNAFTNAMAAWNLRRGVDAAAWMGGGWAERWNALRDRLRLDETEVAAWSSIAAGMTTGLDPVSCVYEQFAGYFDLAPVNLAEFGGDPRPIDVILGRARTQASQVIKQADVVELLALMPGLFDAKQAAANFDYYAPRCAHGSSLSPATHALVAARLGRPEAALGYFRQAAEIDLGPPDQASGGGLHLATLGGLWQAAVFGFGGLSLTGGEMAFEPCLPASCRRLSFGFQWRGRSLKIDIEPEAFGARLESGEALTLRVGGSSRQLAPGAPLRVRTRAERTSA